jgi:hypothetical protein
MIFLQRIPFTGSNLIVRGVAYRFDLLGFYKGVVDFKFINLEPVRVVSYITQGNVSEVCTVGDKGEIVTRKVIPINQMMNEITWAKESDDCVGVLIRNLNIDGVVGTNYLVLYRGEKEV